MADLEIISYPELEFSHRFIDNGPESIESELDEILAAPDTAAKIVEAEREGVDAVVIDCLGDPGMKAGREATKIPVIGAGETSMHVAAMLGHRFSIITTLDRVCHMNENQAKIYGVHEKFASCRAVNTPVLDLEQSTQTLIRDLVDAGELAIREDGAHVLLFGCTGMSKVAIAVEEGLKNRGFDVPVVEPLSTAIHFAYMILQLGYRYSGITYPLPPQKTIVGYSFPEIRKTK
jgi:allantoin racemase